MNRYIAFKIITVLFLFNLCVWPASAQENEEAPVGKIRPAVVAVTAYNGKGEIIEQGSGFFISREGRLITNRHVLKGASKAEARTSNGKIYAVKTVIAENRDLDLIQLMVDSTGSDVPVLTMAEETATQGQSVIVIGHQDTIRGSVSNVRQLGEAGRNFEFSANLASRATGGPVVNEKGDVIGMVALQIVQDQVLNLAIASGSVLAMVPGRPQALADWSASLGAEPPFAAEGLFFAGIYRIFNGDYAKALVLLEEAAQRNAGDAEVRLRCGYAKARLKRYEEAMQDYREAVRLAPGFADALNNLGATYHNLGRHKEAVEVYMQAIKLKPDFTLAYNNLGAAYAHLGRHEDAIVAYKQVLGYDTRSAVTYLNMGVAYDELGDRQKAIESLRMAIQIRPGYADAHNRLGYILVKQGRAQEAVEFFRKAIELRPDFAEARFNLGVSNMILGNSDSAFEAYGALKSLNQNLASQLYDLIEKNYSIAAAASQGRTADRFDASQPPASQAAIVRLIDSIKGMVAKGTLRRDAGDELIAELQIASRQPDTGNTIIKINLLNSFIERVGDLINQQALPADDGHRLINATNTIINRVSS
jgi:tetratricopeptide (TPR) repeat protein